MRVNEVLSRIEDTEVINLWRKTHTLACGMKVTFHFILLRLQN